VADLFVGRQRELQVSLDLLAALGEGAVQDIVGVRGAGKSTFLLQLSDRARNTEPGGQEVLVHNLDMQQHALGVGFLPGDLGASASPDILREVFSTSRQLMEAIAQDRREFRCYHRNCRSRPACLLRPWQTSR
jgi:ABC-type Mn2+/Zn2+ transport system ATPase subunit